MPLKMSVGQIIKNILYYILEKQIKGEKYGEMV